MRPFVVMLVMASVAGCIHGTTESHRDYLRTSDYGILSPTDTRAYAEATGNQPSPQLVPGMAYWQCFHAKELNAVRCEDLGKDDDLGHVAELDIKIGSGQRKVDVGGRRALDLQFCRRIKHELQSILKGQEHFCLGAVFGSVKGSQEEWTFDKIKTKTGCVSYFENDCG